MATAAAAKVKTIGMKECLLCDEGNDRVRSLVCAKCASWYGYWGRRNAFQFKHYKTKIARAETRIENRGDYASARSGVK